MIRILSILFFVVAQSALSAPAAMCAGANPAITSVGVKNVTSNGSLNEYHIEGTVTNLGSSGQSRNTLQFVDIWQYGVHMDDRGIPPLAPGQSYKFGYVWQRNAGAGSGTTSLDFRMRMVSGSNCNPGNGNYHITF
jgi:hypothetical protein